MPTVTYSNNANPVQYVRVSADQTIEKVNGAEPTEAELKRMRDFKDVPGWLCE